MGPAVLEWLTEVLKGRGFKPRRKCHQINPALAAEAAPPIAMSLFPQSVPAAP